MIVSIQVTVRGQREVQNGKRRFYNEFYGEKVRNNIDNTKILFK